MPKFSYALLAALSALAFTVANAAAQPAQNVGTIEQIQIAPQAVILQAAPPPPPRFRVRATTLYANDETGPDWPGVDEVYAVFILSPPDSKAADGFLDFEARTSNFEDFDTGETKSFDATQNCLTSAVATQTSGDTATAWDCDELGATGPLEFTVRLYEDDTWYDDLIGEATVQWAQWELAAVPVGGISEESVRIGGYTLSWRLERIS